MGEQVRYSDSGVDVDSGDRASDAFYQAARRTWSNRHALGRIIAPFDDFTGLRYIELPAGKGLALGKNSDGIGTKAEIAERLGKFDTLGYDLVGMTADDSAMRGTEPIALTNTLDVNRISNKQMQELAKGLELAAKCANVGVINGEIAELGDRVGGYGNFRLNWSADCLWIARRDRLIDGKKVKVGEHIVAFKENGFRSNGYTLARKIMEKAYGNEWQSKNKAIARGMLLPSTIFTKLIVQLTGGVEGEPKAQISAMAHITGGGILGKLGRALKASGLGAELDSPFGPPKVMKEVIEIGGVETREAYSTWNMGNGFMVITNQPENVIKQARRMGIDAKVAGRIKSEKEIGIRTYNGERIAKKIAA